MRAVEAPAADTPTAFESSIAISPADQARERARIRTERHPFLAPGLVRSTLPFGIVLIGAFVVVPLAGGSELDVLAASLAAILAGMLIVAAFVGPWHRLPAWARMLPPLGLLIVVALLREAAGESRSGFAALVLIVPVWAALYEGTRSVIAAIVGVTLTLILPIVLIGAPEYPPKEQLQQAAIIIGFSIFIGFAVQRLVQDSHNRAAEARRSRRFMLAAMSSAVEGFVALDGKGQVVFANRSAQRMLGLDAEQMIGADFHDLAQHSTAAGEPNPREGSPLEETLRTGEARAGARRGDVARGRQLVPGGLPLRRLHRPRQRPRGRGGQLRRRRRAGAGRAAQGRAALDRRPRAANAADLDPRLARAGRRGLELRAQPAGGADDRDRDQQHGPALAADQRHPRSRADRVGQGAADPEPVRRARPDRDRAGDAHGAGERGRRRARGPPGRGDALGRPRSHPAGADEPDLERDQVLAGRLGRHGLRLRGGRPGPLRGGRSRPRHPRREDRHRLRALRPGRRLRLARQGRHRPRPADLADARPPARRPDLDRERARDRGRRSRSRSRPCPTSRPPSSPPSTGRWRSSSRTTPARPPRSRRR